MSEANELLDSLTEDEVATYTATPETEPHIVIGNDRKITVPDELKRIGVQFDHNIETVTFDCPRYWDSHDMSAMRVFINYKRADDYVDSYPVDDVTVDDTDDTVMHFSWTIHRSVTSVKGTLSFLVCIKSVSTGGKLKTHWNSELNKEMYISEGMNCEETVSEEYPDIITQLLVRMGELEDEMSKLENGMPEVTTDDNGKLLQVVDGSWKAVAVADSSIGAYIDSYINEALGGDY
jgi:hypothetical protein